MEMLAQQSVAVINVTRDEHNVRDVTAESERGAVVVRCNCYGRTGGSMQSFSDCDTPPFLVSGVDAGTEGREAAGELPDRAEEATADRRRAEARCGGPVEQTLAPAQAA